MAARAPAVLHSLDSPPPPYCLPRQIRVTEAFDTYWRFAAERQEIFFRRLHGHDAPWTDDPILREFKFTNAYRASDRVSQYLIREVIYSGDDHPAELFFRILLFKIFNKIDTWELLTAAFGEVSLASYSYDRYDRILTQALGRGARIYSAAYIMPSGGRLDCGKKHRMHLRLIEKMIEDDVPRALQKCRSMQEAFIVLRSYPTIGNFLAYQFVTDLNYSTLLNFSELEFVVPGPGAMDGVHKCFADRRGFSAEELIRLMVDTQEAQFERLGIRFKSLWGRRLQLIDCQNLFCEVDKYSRKAHPDIPGVSGRTKIKQRFRPDQARIPYWYPPKWELNHLVAR